MKKKIKNLKRLFFELGFIQPYFDFKSELKENTGFDYQPESGGSLLGAAIGWGEPNETTFSTGLDNQITTEVFYRVQISSRFAITPDLQYLINPELNPDQSSIFLWGIRGRLAL